LTFISTFIHDPCLTDTTDAAAAAAVTDATEAVSMESRASQNAIKY